MTIMGINGLWHILKPAAQICTLSNVTLMNSYSAVDRTSFLCIGADISVIMNKCVAADKAAHMYQHRFSGALHIFFFKLCKFLCEAPVIVIFVFEGPDRPSFKHRRKINTQTILEWSQQYKAISELFGFYWLQAPSKAEAELALLSRNKAIDVILTSDSDLLVFGAGHVMKSIAHLETYEVYNMDAIKDNPSVGLSQGGLLLIAILWWRLLRWA
ncbi:PIN domain-like protein [Flammula alnicola]|nr:PIN domain-like protein [Flammula alnicola]